MIRIRRIPIASPRQSIWLCAVRSLTLALFAIAAITLSAVCHAQRARRPRGLGATAGEVRAQAALDSAKRYGMPGLYAFLKPFPKGADLHMHLSGAIYAETFITEAVKQNLCVVPVPHSDAPGKPPSPIGQDAVEFEQPPCSNGAVPVSNALTNQALYDNLIDSFSMRAFVPTEGIDGHDQFFATFARFGGLKDETGEWLDEVATRAAAQNEQYLEIMSTPTFSNAAKLGGQIGWPAGSEKQVSHETLAALRDKLLAAGLRSEVAVDEKELADAKEARATLERCSPAQDYVNSGEQSSCFVRVHFLFQVLRGFPPQQVFAQTLLGFEVASADPDVVGINFVMPEDGRISMQDYHLQMQMLDYLHSVYPHVHISLHAGELAPGLVPPEGLRFHIREAVELGRADRIGHGVDILYEDHPYDLLREMAAKHIDVEINLTSNDGILSVKGADHPLATYMAAHVPFSLSTDDEGVSRIDLTHEYARAVEEHALTYLDLKRSARDSLEHSFLHGQSLYSHPDDYAHMRPECSGPIASDSKPANACSRFLKANEKAATQWELERRFAGFEKNPVSPVPELESVQMPRLQVVR